MNEYITRLELAALLDVPHNTTLRDRIREAGVQVAQIDRKACIRTCDIPAIAAAFGKKLPAAACGTPAEAENSQNVTILEPLPINRGGAAPHVRDAAEIHLHVSQSSTTINSTNPADHTRPTASDELRQLRQQISILERDAVNIRELAAIRDAVETLQRQQQVIEKTMPVLFQTIEGLRQKPDNTDIYKRLEALEWDGDEDEIVPPRRIEIKLNLQNILIFCAAKSFDILEMICRTICIAVLWAVFCRKFADALGSVWIPPGHTVDSWNSRGTIRKEKLRPVGTLKRKAIR
jgi:hypothetical protein